MRTLALLALMTVAGRAEVITYWLHGATIGNDPNHAVNAAVTGEFYYDVAANHFMAGGFNFYDNGLQGEWQYGAVASDLEFRDGIDSAHSITYNHGIPYEKYPLASGRIAFGDLISGTSVALDLPNSFVRIDECPVTSNHGCDTDQFNTVILHFNSGYISTQQLETSPVSAPSFAAPVANPEPGTFVLSATCGCLLAIWMKRKLRCQ